MIRSDSRHSCGLDRTYSELLEDEGSDEEDSWAFRDYVNRFHRLRKFLPTFHPRLQQDSNITHRNVENNWIIHCISF